MGGGEADGARAVFAAWVDHVTVDKDPKAVGSLFCPGAVLVGTVSRTLREGDRIAEYFEYFAKIPGLQSSVTEELLTVVDDRTDILNVFVDWTWTGGGEGLTARMSFVCNGGCISMLHSSVLPALNPGLVKVSADGHGEE